MCSETTAIAKLSDQFFEFTKNLQQLPKIPLGEELYGREWDDSKSHFTLIKMMYDANPQPLREAILHVMKNAEFKERDNRLFYILYLSEGLKDADLKRDIFNILFTDKKLTHLWVIEDYHFSSTHSLFGFSPSERRKEVFLKILEETKKVWRGKIGKRYSKILPNIYGRFIAEQLRIIESFRGPRKRLYLEFFIKNFTQDERGQYLKYMLSHWGFNTRKLSLDIYNEVADEIRELKGFHPSLTQLHLDMSSRVVRENTLQALSNSRYFYYLPKNAEHIKQVVSEIHRKCYREKHDFFDFTKRFEKELGSNNIDKYRNFV